MRRKTTLLGVVVLASVMSAEAADSVPKAGEVLPMRSKAPLVYETPLRNAVILEFQLYDNETWCWLYLRKDVWKAMREDDGDLPADVDIGQLQCERR